MKNRGPWAACWTATGALLTACQTHLPELETAPKGVGPKTADIINHIACEIGTVVNYQTTDPDSPMNARIHQRVRGTHVGDWLHELRDYHFVATAQVSVEVTDNEGVTPSLNYLNKSGSLTVGLGGQLSGTQDRSLTLNYAIDLHDLTPERVKAYCAAPNDGTETKVAKALGLAGTISGELGLADIIADGLIALHTSEDTNIYSSSGPVPPVVVRKVNQDGNIIASHVHIAGSGGTAAIDQPRRDIRIQSLAGTMQFTPQAPGASTSGAVSLAGMATLSYEGKEAQYIINWTGSILPQGPHDSLVYFTLTGNLTPLPRGSELADLTTGYWGYNPAVTLTGSVDSKYTVDSLKITGALNAASNTDYEKAHLVALSLKPISPPPKTAKEEETPGGGPGGGGGGAPSIKGGGASASAAGGTSFGSLVDFVLVYGANAGPTWTFKRFKGPEASGSTPLFAGSRTKTDSLAITFVATCQEYHDLNDVPWKFRKYWDSIGPCDDTSNVAQQQGASVGYQNNSLMILRNFLVKP